MTDFVLSDPRTDASDPRAVSFAVHVPHDLKYLEGHFPGRPIVPGIAQLALIERAAHVAWPDLGAPSGLRRLKFTRELGPGDDFTISLERAGDDVRFTIKKGEDEHSRGLVKLRTRSAPTAPG